MRRLCDIHIAIMLSMRANSRKHRPAMMPAIIPGGPPNSAPVGLGASNEISEMKIMKY